MPVLEDHIEGTGTENRSDPADNRVALQIKQKEHRANFTRRTRRKGKVTDEDFAKHSSPINAGTRNWRLPANRHAGIVHTRQRAIRRPRFDRRSAKSRGLYQFSEVDSRSVLELPTASNQSGWQ